MLSALYKGLLRAALTLFVCSAAIITHTAVIQPAMAQSIKSDISLQWLINGFAGVIVGLLSIMYALHKSQYNRDMKNIEKQRAEDKEASEKNAMSVQQSLDKISNSLERREHEFWNALNQIKDRQNQLELNLAREHHTKQEMGELLDTKLKPLYQMVSQLSARISGKVTEG